MDVLAFFQAVVAEVVVGVATVVGVMVVAATVMIKAMVMDMMAMVSIYWVVNYEDNRGNFFLVS